MAEGRQKENLVIISCLYLRTSIWKTTRQKLKEFLCTALSLGSVCQAIILWEFWRAVSLSVLEKAKAYAPTPNVTFWFSVKIFWCQLMPQLFWGPKSLNALPHRVIFSVLDSHWAVSREQPPQWLMGVLRRSDSRVLRSFKRARGENGRHGQANVCYRTPPFSLVPERMRCRDIVYTDKTTFQIQEIL